MITNINFFCLLLCYVHTGMMMSNGLNGNQIHQHHLWNGLKMIEGSQIRNQKNKTENALNEKLILKDKKGNLSQNNHRTNDLLSPNSIQNEDYEFLQTFIKNHNLLQAFLKTVLKRSGDRENSSKTTKKKKFIIELVNQRKLQDEDNENTDDDEGDDENIDDVEGDDQDQDDRNKSYILKTLLQLIKQFSDSYNNKFSRRSRKGNRRHSPAANNIITSLTDRDTLYEKDSDIDYKEPYKPYTMSSNQIVIEQRGNQVPYSYFGGTLTGIRRTDFPQRRNINNMPYYPEGNKYYDDQEQFTTLSNKNNVLFYQKHPQDFVFYNPKQEQGKMLYFPEQPQQNRGVYLNYHQKSNAITYRQPQQFQYPIVTNSMRRTVYDKFSDSRVPSFYGKQGSYFDYDTYDSTVNDDGSENGIEGMFDNNAYEDNEQQEKDNPIVIIEDKKRRTTIEESGIV